MQQRRVRQAVVLRLADEDREARGPGHLVGAVDRLRIHAGNVQRFQQLEPHHRRGRIVQAAHPGLRQGSMAMRGRLPLRGRQALDVAEDVGRAGQQVGAEQPVVVHPPDPRNREAVFGRLEPLQRVSVAA